MEYNGDSIRTDPSAIEVILLDSEYSSTNPFEGDLWNHQIRNVYDERASNEFTLEIVTDDAVSIEWNIDVPLSTDKESSEVTKLIENQGGQINLLEDGGEVSVLRKKDVPSGLEVVGYDKSDRWALVNISSLNEWIEENNGTEESQTNQSDIQSKLRESVVYSAIEIATIAGLRGFVLSDLKENTQGQVSAEYLELADTMTILVLFIAPTILYGLTYLVQEFVRSS